PLPSFPTRRSSDLSHQQDLPRDQPDPRVRHCPLPHFPSSGVPSPNLRLGDKAPRMSPPRSGGRYRRRCMPPPWLCPPEPQAKGGRFLPPNEVRREVGGSRSRQQDLPRDQPDPRVRHCPLPHCPSSGVPFPQPSVGGQSPLDQSPTKRGKVPPPEHGAAVRSAGVGGNRPQAEKPGSLRSRPLPASGRTPPLRCRSTGEKS